jgi:beta-N-acetylhexosaminidase
VLHCNGKMEEMREVASEVKPLDGQAERRAAHALSLLITPEAFDPGAAEARLTELLGGAE